MTTEGFRTMKLLIKQPLNQPDLAAFGHYELLFEVEKCVWSPSVSFESEILEILHISADLHEKMSSAGPPGSDPADFMGQGAA